MSTSTPDLMTHLGPPETYTAFLGTKRLLTGHVLDIAMAVRAASTSDSLASSESLLIFDDATGRTIDLDTRGSDADIAARFTFSGASGAGSAPSYGITKQQQQPAEPIDTRLMVQGRGRPKLGVVAREVTLLPRHWDWLNAQPGGASVSLRRLVDEARHAGGSKERIRKARDAAYHFMSAIAGDLPGFEEATRALYAGDAERFRSLIAAWPPDIREHADKLAFAQTAA